MFWFPVWLAPSIILGATAGLVLGPLFPPSLRRGATVPVGATIALAAVAAIVVLGGEMPGALVLALGFVAVPVATAVAVGSLRVRSLRGAVPGRGA